MTAKKPPSRPKPDPNKPRKTDSSTSLVVPATTLRYRNELYYKLSIDSTTLATTPRISHILATIPGGVHKCIEYLYGSEEPEARAFVTLYDSILANPAQFDCLLKGDIPFEAFCVKLAVTTKRMLEVIMGACFEQSNHASTLMAAASHPSVVGATIDSALSPFGHNDRKLLHQHSKFIPVPKNNTMFVAPGGHGTIDNSTATNSNNQTIAVTELSRIEVTMSKIADRFNERMGINAPQALPAPPDPATIEFSDPEPIEVESEAVDASDLTPDDSDWSA